MKKSYRSIDYKTLEIYRNVSEEDWNDWKWQLGHAIRDIPALKKVITIDKELEADLENCLKTFKMAITPYYASLMDEDYDRGVIRLQAVPSIHELHMAEDDQDDPLHEDVDSPVPGLTHRYPDRVLMRVTHLGSM
jgi:lysine 2,3-aminomutase